MLSRIDRFTARLAEEGPVVLLESQSPDHPAARTSWLAGAPESVLRIPASAGPGSGENPWRVLSEWRRSHGGWAFGFLGYDLKNHLEELRSENPDRVNAPDLFFMQPGVLLRLDHRTGELAVLKGSVPEAPPVPDKGFSVDRFGPVTGKQRYLQQIREIQHRIREGEFYEVNLSHRMEGEFTGEPFDLYRSMREIGPVPFGAYLSTGDLQVCSLSPERFLSRTGDRVISQPIKGTVERGDSPEADRRLLDSLAESDKNRAENIMIVDLVRNDLGRIARRGSVRVRDLCQIQSFGTVHQMVSTVEAESDCSDPLDIIRACYPMGSMTGAPKIRAMRTIEELEDYRRGIYSGAIGYLTPDGDFDFNVVIRTAIIRGRDLFYPVGGAITGDSDPEEEWKETLVKGRALTRLFP